MAGTGFCSASSGNQIRAASIVPSFNGINVCSITRTVRGNVVTITGIPNWHDYRIAEEGVGPSQVEDHLAPRPGAANERVSLCGRIQRLRVVVHVASNQRRFAGVADPGPTGPPHRHIACFRKLEQTLVFRIPRQGEPAAREGHLRSETRRSRRQMRSMRLGFHPRGDGIERAEYLGMNMISGHTPRRQAGAKLAQERRGAAQIELAFMRNADLIEGGNRQVPGSVEIDTPLVGWPRPAVLDVAVAGLLLL